MPSRGKARALLVTVREAMREAIHPEATADASTLRAFRTEARKSNVLTVRWAVLFLGPLHALILVVFCFFHETEPARASWLWWLMGINAALLAADVVGAVVVSTGRPSALFRSVGDIGGVLYLLGGALMTANAQRAYPNLNIFIVTAFFTAFRLRMRPRIYVPALLVGDALVLAAMTRFRSEALLRTADYLTLLSVSSLALAAFFLARGMRFRELAARCQVQRLNAQLNEKIRERSRELSMALACLAEGHRQLEPGTVLGGRVELEAPLGRGGMGIVYSGRDLLTNSAVAVKVVQAGSAHELDGLHRFLREAQIVASITHPAIVRSLHVDVSEEGRLFQVMELVEGETLASHLARAGTLPALVVARLGAVLADALATAHEAGVVHLDVKPANVILTKAKPGLKLLDFGISRLRDVRAISAGAGGRIVGTPEFLSPEQVNDPGSLDGRADVYALGLVLYLAIAGRMPFDASSPPEWVLAHSMHEPLELRESVPRIDPELARLVMSCLRKKPAERPAASVVATRLAAFADAVMMPPLEALGLSAVTEPSDSQRHPRPAQTGTVAVTATTQHSGPASGPKRASG